MSYGIAVLASMVVAITVTPALSLMLFQKTRLVRARLAVLRLAQEPLRRHARPQWPRAALAVALVAAVAGLALCRGSRSPTAPTFKEPDLLVHWDAMPGTSRAGDEPHAWTGSSRELRAVPGVRNVGGHVGRAILSDQVVGINSSELWVSLDPKADYEKTVAAVERRRGRLPRHRRRRHDLSPVAVRRGALAASTSRSSCASTARSWTCCAAKPRR